MLQKSKLSLSLIIATGAFFVPVMCGADTSSGTAVTLQQCFEWTRAQNEDLRSRQEEIKQSHARGQAALGGAFPRIAWKLDETWNDPKGVEELEAQGFSGFVEKRQTQSRFTANQPLFSGLREFSAYSAFKRESARDALNYERAAFELYQQTADVFYSIIGMETELANTKAALGLADDRVKELQGFLRLGKSRDSEVYTAKAYAAGWRANLDLLEAGIRTTRTELSYLTGRDMSDVPLLDQISNTLTLPTVDEALMRAKERTDVRAQKEEVDAYRLRIRYERGHYWPSADLTGNYYTERATFLDKIDWDVVLSVDFPLFQGGTVSAAVKEARSMYRQSVLRLQKLERYVDYSVRKTHGDLEAAIKQTASLDEAARAAQQSYDSLRKEYRLGLVTNLDVLQSLDFLQQQKTRLDASRIRTKRLFIELNTEMEKLL